MLMDYIRWGLTRRRCDSLSNGNMLKEHQRWCTTIIDHAMCYRSPSYDAQIITMADNNFSVVPSLWAGIIIYYYHLPTLPIDCHNGNLPHTHPDTGRSLDV